MSRFDGRWQLITEEAKTWDFEKGAYFPDEVGEEIITIHTDGDVQDYEVLYGDDPVIRMGYTARFNDPEWQEYTVREIITEPGADVDASVSAFRDRIKATEGVMRRQFEVGKPYGIVRVVYGDERTHYRFGRATDSDDVTHVLMRRLAEDGQRYDSYVFGVDGIVNRIRPFRRMS